MGLVAFSYEMAYWFDLWELRAQLSMNMRHGTATTLTLSAGFVLLWNSGFIGAEYGLPYTEPFTLLFWRYAVLTMVLCAYLKLRGRCLWPGFSPVFRATVVGVLAHGVWLGCVLMALQRDVPAGIVALVVALQPLMTGAFSGPVLGEHTNPRQWLGLIVGFVGVALAVGGRLSVDSSASLFGYLIPFGSPIAITAASLFQRSKELAGHTQTISLDVDLFYQCLATTVAVSIPAGLVEQFVTRWETPFLLTMGWLIFAVSLGAYGLMWRLLTVTSATRVASLFYLGPPVTMLMAWIAFGDVLQTTDTIGLVVTGFGVLLVHRS